EHIFKDCRVAKEIWIELLVECVQHEYFSLPFKDWLRHNCNGKLSTTMGYVVCNNLMELTISGSLGIPRLMVNVLIKPPEDCHPFSTLIEECLAFIAKDHLMNLAQVIDVGLVLLEAPPEDLLPFLQHDAC
ncbi:hypothetical protein Goklo_012452, partial [Gossypium klotzschianum]|nr:hypothetical protein [Gossypium klotzschianum]